MGKARAKLGFGVRPQASCATCLSKEGCSTCSTVCAEDLNLSAGSNPSAVLESCTLCLDCTEGCPAKSISLKLGPEKLPTTPGLADDTETVA